MKWSAPLLICQNPNSLLLRSIIINLCIIMEDIWDTNATCVKYEVSWKYEKENHHTVVFLRTLESRFLVIYPYFILNVLRVGRKLKFLDSQIPPPLIFDTGLWDWDITVQTSGFRIFYYPIHSFLETSASPHLYSLFDSG